MRETQRPRAFWIIVAFLTVSIVVLLMGQTLSVFRYDLTVRLGMQESPEQVGEFGVQVNRAFAAGDTAVYIPLIIASLVGLWLRKRWSLLTSAAVAGVSAYWAVTIGFMLAFLRGAPDYSYTPPIGIWTFVAVYFLFGVWCLFYLLARREALLQ